MKYLLPCLLTGALAAAVAPASRSALPPGGLVDLGGYRLHLNCKGQGPHTVVIENGFDEFSSDWAKVQEGISNLGAPAVESAIHQTVLARRWRIRGFSCE